MTYIHGKEKTIQILKSGDIVAHPTETCYGFTCDALNKEGVRRLYQLKNMPREKPVSIMVSRFRMAKKYGHFNKAARENRVWQKVLFFNLNPLFFLNL